MGQFGLIGSAFLNFILEKQANKIIIAIKLLS